MAGHEDRILFLKQFARELVINSLPPGYQPPLKPLQSAQLIEIPKPLTQLTNFRQIIDKNFENKPKIFANQRYQLKPIVPAGFKPSLQVSKPEFIKAELPENFDLGKLNPLLKDSRVTVIECPSPDKFLLVRSLGNTTLTKIALNQQEIQALIEKFSTISKVPIINGIFKAVIGNLSITAIISDLVGNRFILTKITPSFIDQEINSLLPIPK